jgi:ribosomal 30S subunit maturation factor RimM
MKTSAHIIHAKPTQKVGFVVKTHGYKGGLLLALTPPYDEVQEGILALIEEKGFLLLVIEDQWVPYEISDINVLSGIVSLKNIINPEQAETLCGLSFCLPADELQPFHATLSEWKAYTLLNSQGKKMGVIQQTISMPGHTLLNVINDNGKDFLVPFHPELLVSVQDDLKQITLLIPDGLEDL